ncbi:MAG TPA: mannosyltransferase family protein [Gaiellaceae bacterium]
MRRDTLWVFAWSRIALWIGAIFALLAFVPGGNPHNIHRDDPNLIHDLGRLTDVWARWDSFWFIQIAHHGYNVAPGTPAFYPLYPGLVAVVGRVFLGHYVLAGIAVSLLATLGSFVLLDRLAERLLGPDVARRSVLFLAVFPMSLFLQAVYSESIFLFVAIAAFLAAERRHFPLAGLCCGLALLARPTGLAVLLGVAVIAFRTPRRLRNLASLAIAAPVFGLFPLTLQLQTGHPFAFLHVEHLWYRQTATLGPVGGIWEALRAAWASVLQLTVGSNSHWYWEPVSPDHFAAVNLESTLFFVFAVTLGIVAWRKLGAPYGLMALAAVIAPTAAPTHTVPLLSMPRFTLVAFPIFIALAAVCTSPRAERAVVGISASLLGVALVQWALWQFVS